MNACINARKSVISHSTTTSYLNETNGSSGTEIRYMCISDPFLGSFLLYRPRVKPKATSVGVAGISQVAPSLAA